MANLLWQVTFKCNLSCKYCTVKDSMREPNIENDLRLIQSSDCDWVFITGGEPLLRPDIKDICNRIHSFGKKVGLSTNGTIHNDVTKYVDRLGVSIDGERDYHNKYRDGSYDSAVEFLKSIIGKTESVIMYTYFPKYGNQRSYLETLGENIGVDFLQITKGL